MIGFWILLGIILFVIITVIIVCIFSKKPTSNDNSSSIYGVRSTSHDNNSIDISTCFENANKTAAAHGLRFDDQGSLERIKD